MVWTDEQDQDDTKALLHIWADKEYKGQKRNKSRIVAEYMGNSRCQFHVRHSYTRYALLLCAAQFLFLS